MRRRNCHRGAWQQHPSAGSSGGLALAVPLRARVDERVEVVGQDLGWSMEMRVRLSSIHASWVFGNRSARRSAWTGA